jgi:hypothetical protein
MLQFYLIFREEENISSYVKLSLGYVPLLLKSLFSYLILINFATTSLFPVLLPIETWRGTECSRWGYFANGLLKDGNHSIHSRIWAIYCSRKPIFWQQRK